MHVLFKLTSVLTSGFVGIILLLDSMVIYGNIAPVFRIFMAISGARLLSSDAYTDIANKVYAIVGVVMLFVLAYAILRAIIDPDQSMKNELGPQIVKRIVIAVVGLALAPVIFNVMYQGQSLFLEHDVLAKIFFRGNSDLEINMGQSSVDVGDSSIPIEQNVNVDEQIKHIGGGVTAVSLWQAFFFPSEDSGKTADEIEADPKDYFLSSAAYLGACAGLAAGAVAVNGVPVIGQIASVLLGAAAIYSCITSVVDGMTASKVSNITNGDSITLSEAYAYAAGGGSFGVFTVFLDNYVDDGDITYLFGLSTIAGAFTLYAFISFSIDMGIRAAKLAYYQIIAPVPLIMQVLPSFKSNFSQYLKSVVSTFMEVFVRISVVYIVVYIICHLTEMFSSVDALWGNQNLSGIETMLALALLILGLVAFARSAPDFITSSLGIKKGDMKLGIGEKFAKGGGFAAEAVARSGLQTAVQNWNKGKDKGQGAFKRLGSAFAGGASAMARSSWQQFGPGEGHKMANTHAEATRVAGTANEAAFQRGVDRDERKEQHASDVTAYNRARAAYEAAQEEVNRLAHDPSATQAQKVAADAALEAAANALTDARVRMDSSTALGTAVNNAYKKATVWATGTIDTSKMDKQVKLFQDLAGLKSQLENTIVGKDEYVNKAQRRIDDLARTDIADYAYSNALREKATNDLTAAGALARLAGESDADYARRRETLISSKMKDLGQSTFKRTDYSVDVRSAEYAKAQEELLADRKKADDDLKAAKKEAVARKLVEASSGIDNDTSRALKAFFETHQQDLDTYRDVLFNGQQSLGDYITENFGANAISGVVDFTTMNKGVGRFTLELKNGRTVEVDASGDDVKYTVKNGATVERSNISAEDFRSYVASSGTEVDSSRSTVPGQKAESRASKMKTTAETAEQNFRDSDTYRNAKSRERAQKESKKS